MTDDTELKAWFFREVFPLEAGLTRYIRRNWRSALIPALAVPVSLKAANVKELITLAASSPGKLSYGSSGMGSTPDSDAMTTRSSSVTQ